MLRETTSRSLCGLVSHHALVNAGDWLKLFGNWQTQNPGRYEAGRTLEPPALSKVWDETGRSGGKDCDVQTGIIQLDAVR